MFVLDGCEEVFDALAVLSVALVVVDCAGVAAGVEAGEGEACGVGCDSGAVD